MVERTRPRPISVDREKTCPFLLRVFVKAGSHHDLDRDFQLPDKLPIPDESQLYAWKDTTLRDICLQLIESNPTIKLTTNAKFSIRLVFLDSPREIHSNSLSRYKSQELGTIFSKDLTRDTSSNSIPNSSTRTLQDLQFMVGDYLDIAILSHHPIPTSNPSPTETRGFGIRGAASANSNRNTPIYSNLDGPRWGRPTPSNTWGAPSSGPARWGNPNDRTRTSFDSVPRNRSLFNGNLDRERFDPRYNNGNNRRRHSRSRSPSVPRRAGGRDYPRRGGR